jgi:hypothetical protein
MKKIMKKKMQMRKYDGDFGFNTKASNIFKSGKETKPVHLFGDYDKDNVANVFDCNPINPNEQGFFGALKGAAKGVFTGGVREGWRKGMAEPTKRERERRERVVERARRFGPGKLSPEEQRELSPTGRIAMGRKVEGELQTDLSKAQDKARIRKRFLSKVQRPFTREELDKRGRPVIRRLSIPEHMQRRMFDIPRGRVPRVDRKRIMAQKKLAQMAFPVIPSSALVGAEGAVAREGSSKPTKGYARPGRPRGTYDPRYAAYGGVFGYRKALRARRAMERAKEQLQETQMRQAQMPQYETTPYTPMPPEMEAQAQRMQQQIKQLQAGVPPEQIQGLPELPEEVADAEQEFSQFEQHQVQQMPQPQPQLPQFQQQPFQYLQEQAVRRPVATVFRSSGGSPYPPVDSRPLMPSRAIPGYVEDVDAFTGRRFLRKLPQTEKWAGGQR